MKPWTSGPRELLDHASGHFDLSSPFDLRIAFISIDNAVELIIKTYLGLPKRIRKIDGPSRRKLSEASNSFPDLLDLLELYGVDKLEGIDLGDIEWYHRIRNTLYHDGNGVTVDKEKVDSYLQIARILFDNLFDERVSSDGGIDPRTALGEIILRASQLEHYLSTLHQKHYPEYKGKRFTVKRLVWDLGEGCHLTPEIAVKISNAIKVRNESVHSTSVTDAQVIMEAANELEECVASVEKLI
jgi:uncharacterized protein YutE (UPF0331/DUF86 family)